MSVHAVAALRAHFGTEVPPVLWTPPDPRRVGAARTETHAAAAGFDDDELLALQVLAAPEVRLEGRTTGSLDAKFCLARTGHVTARVLRSAGTATVDVPYCDGAAARFAALVAPYLGDAPAADPSVAASFATEPGRDALRSGGDAGRIAAELRATGIDSDAARLIGRVFARARRSVEFTVHAGERRLGPVAAVIDSPDGRIVALTTIEPDGRSWTSVSEGSGHRIGRALRRACEELPGGGWTP
ncbi:ESX secretion-associated protein EspG [Tsukamurella sp. 1534]|uniref:ESX secretion-associated protein EspG n=1 Tax=Tsukamurella sp. 1534 TaxID=1151061 RepID=UPI000594A118|nr:ESX secretion-associated protein EspG [Tsukamurella sp. 1534]